MKKIGITLAAVIFGSMNMMGQNPYEAERFATNDLNGTARYVAMGGALSALGGDISVMSINPAGTGVYKKSDIAVTVSGVICGTGGVLGYDKAKMSFDQCGTVVTLPTSSLEGMVLGINVSKNKNHLLNIDTDIANLGDIYSQTHQIADLANDAFYGGGWGALADMSAPIYKDNIIDDDGENLQKHGIINPITDDDKNIIGYEGVGAYDAHYQRASYGSSMDVDMNLAFNIDNKFFIGGTLGIYDVDTRRTSMYEELGVDGNYYDFTNYYDTRGTGFDFKLGTIIRPIDDNAFRIGAYIHTPIWYQLEDVNGSVLYLNDQYLASKDYDPYQYKLRTPWQFGVSLGTTIENVVAIGAEYMYQDLSSCKYTLRGSGGTSSYFQYQNEMMKTVLQGQHTFKIGMEAKPSKEFSIRCGYNYVSAPMKSTGYNTLACDGVFTETDFCNWKDTNRFTFGFGYKFTGGYFDMTYQYSTQKGDFYAFDDVTFEPTEIENNRSQIMATLGFRF